MAFDSPADVYNRALPAGHRFDPFNEESRAEHNAALDEVARVHPVTSWQYRRDGWSNEDVDRCVEILARQCPDDYVKIARTVLTKKQVANWNHRRKRGVASEKAKDGRFRQKLINEGEHPDDAAKAVRYSKKPRRTEFERPGPGGSSSTGPTMGR